MGEVRWTPLLFKPEMVRAILRGDKTNTRRLVKPQPIPAAELGDEEYDGPRQFFVENGELRTPARYGSHPVPCPYGGPGDMIWGRETILPRSGLGWTQTKVRDATYVCFLDGSQKFKKDGSYHEWKSGTPPKWGRPDMKWSPSIHMPRWACRLNLLIESVKLERLQDISEADILAEGVTVANVASWLKVQWASMPTLHDAWRVFWDSINGEGSWAADPWVWAIKFRRLVDGT